MVVKFERIPTPKIVLKAKEGEKHLWAKYFHELHYMTANKDPKKTLPNSCKFYTFYWNNILVGCLGVVNQINKYPARRITRLVVKSEFQGMGFSKMMLNAISEMYKKRGITMYIATFHPRLGNMLMNSKEWKASKNNLKEFKESTQLGGKAFKRSIRDGVAMYRYHYIGIQNYTEIFNPLEHMELQRLIDNETDKDCFLYKKRVKEIRRIEKLKYGRKVTRL